MRNLFICLGLCLLSVAAFSRQEIVTPKGANSDQTLLKIHQVDMLTQLLPLAIKKDQFNPILIAIEKARANEKKIRAMEDSDLEKIDPELGDAVKNGIEKGTFPSHDMEVRAATLLRAMGIRRQVALGENIESVYEAVKATFDLGQLKVMANSLDVSAFDPNLKKDKMDEPARVKFFIRQVLLDGVSYDLLIKLQKMAT